MNMDVDQSCDAGRRHETHNCCPLTRIPLELLLRITSYLTTSELGQLRLVSSRIENALHVTFVNEFFTRKQFMMSEYSLGALVEIAQSRMGAHLRHLHIGLEQYREHDPVPIDEADQEAADIAYFRYIRNFNSQEQLWVTGLANRLLVAAFRLLENLETIIIRDFNSRSRKRDGPLAAWTSFGSNTMLETNMLQPRTIRQHHNVDNPYFSSKVFALVIHALGEADARPKGIEVLERQGHHLHDLAFHVLNSSLPLVVPVLENLEKLHISVHLHQLPSNGQMNSRAHTSAGNIEIRRFLSYTKNLKELRINEHRRHHNRNAVTLLKIFLDWLSEQPPPPPSLDRAIAATVPSFSLPPPVDFSKLENLSLGMMTVGPQTLMQVLTKFAPTLKRLELWRITLSSKPKPLAASWVGFFQGLLKIPNLKLWHVRFGALQRLSDNFLDYNPLPVMFHQEDKHVAEYTGPDWINFMQKLIPIVYVNAPIVDENEDDDDEDEDEEEDEDEDEN